MIARRAFLAGVAGALAIRPAFARPAPLKIGAVLPARTGRPLEDAARAGAAGAAARQGAVFGGEEHGFNAQLLGHRLDVLTASAPDADSSYRAARRLAAEGAFALIGGLYEEQAEALARAAGEAGLLFLNIGCPSDRLRRDVCLPHVFHVEASEAMYLDALASWYVRAGFRRWVLVHAGEERGGLARARAALSVRHWGAQVVDEVAVASGQSDFRAAAAQVAGAKADVVLLLLPWLPQMDFTARLESLGGDIRIAGLPDPVSQTREFYATLRSRAPRLGCGHRAALWEASLDAYGARELNHRFLGRWGVPMDPPAWAAYQAIKILTEAALSVGSVPQDVAARLSAQDAVFDVHKGIGVSFRPWDRQLRQPLYLVKVRDDTDRAMDIAMVAGELPALYQPRSDPIERLDQLGDGPRDSKCRGG